MAESARESTDGVVVTMLSVMGARSMSGGDRIAIELGRCWEREGRKLSVLGCAATRDMWQTNGVIAAHTCTPEFRVARFGVLLAYLFRLVWALCRLPFLASGTWVYSSSDFLTDVFPAFLMKLRCRKMSWIAGVYLLAPNPWRGETGFSWRSLVYWHGQRFSLGLMRRFADMVCVLNTTDREALLADGFTATSVLVLGAGVNASEIRRVESGSCCYDACFIGRFHPQKGLDDLLEAWAQVVRVRPKARLAVIGSGDSTWEVWMRDRVAALHLGAHVALLGFQDGDEKYRILKSSRIFLFPSNRESWGLVVAEALAAGIPVIAYDLPVLREVFGQHILVVPKGCVSAFAEATLGLLEDHDKRRAMSEAGIQFASSFSWENVARHLAAALREGTIR